LPNLDFGNFTNEKSLEGKSNSALIIYLMDKFRLASGKRDSVQCTMLGAWLVELYLHEKEMEKHYNNSSTSSRSKRSLGLFDSRNTSIMPSHSSSRSSSMTSSLKHIKIPSLGSFLANNFRYLDAETVIQILASHDVKASECSGYAAASGNIKTAVNASLSGDLGKVCLHVLLRTLTVEVT